MAAQHTTWHLVLLIIHNSFYILLCWNSLSFCTSLFLERHWIGHHNRIFLVLSDRDPTWISFLIKHLQQNPLWENWNLPRKCHFVLKLLFLVPVCSLKELYPVGTRWLLVLKYEVTFIEGSSGYCLYNCGKGRGTTGLQVNWSQRLACCLGPLSVPSLICLFSPITNWLFPDQLLTITQSAAILEWPASVSFSLKILADNY